ncbi:MAG: DUF5671 domain-containing protein [Candidatus Jorgensenbacteria bacterium]
MERKELIRTIYLYLFSLVGLVLVVIGLVQLVDLGLKTYVFTKADRTVVYPEYPPLVKPAPAGDQGTTMTPEETAAYRAAQEEAQQKQNESQRARTASNSLALLIIGVPLFLYHWRIVQRDKRPS